MNNNVHEQVVSSLQNNLLIIAMIVEDEKLD